MGVALLCAGVAALTLFAFIVWPPLALLTFAAVAIPAGLLTLRRAVRGKRLGPPS